MRTLERVTVVGLLEQFDYTIDFPKTFNFVVLHGPNGSGKTKLLELINATFTGSIRQLVQMPFASVKFEFDDACSLTVFKSGEPTLSGLSEDLEEFQPITFTMHTTEEGPESWQYDPEKDAGSDSMRRIREISAEFDLEYLGKDRWAFADGRILTTSDLPPSLRKIALGTRRRFSQTPEWLKSFINSTNVHLINTQRLQQHANISSKSSREQERRRQNTVDEFAEHLAFEISKALASNSRTSQFLDRSFPRRVLRKNPLGPEVTEERIREKYKEQSAIREELEEIAVLDDQDEISLPEGPLDDWEKRVLWVYLTDSEEKLNTFQTLLDRVNLLREIVNSRFLNKRLAIDREKGFIFKTDFGREIRASQLSSGEQHELVLVYDLLFNVQEKSLVLIDEPELSLHIKWQQEFLADIERISLLAGHQFIVATHSPQVVHKWWNQTVALSPNNKDDI